MRNTIKEKRKMKNEKIKCAFALLAVSCLLFVLACSDLFEPPKLDKPAGDVGYFSLSIAGSGAGNGRTIMPQTVLEESLFDGYTLVFSGAGLTSTTVERDNDDLGDAITLPVGTWDLELTAYKLDGTTKLPLARGNITGIAITSGSPVVQRSIELKPIANNGTGTFSWTITLPADIVSAKMTITPEGAGGTAAQTLWLADGSGNNTPTTLTSLTLNAGYYSVAITMSNGAMTRTREEYLHVYRNMESAYTGVFTGIFDITYVVSGANANTLGTLRYAVANAAANSTIFIDDSVKTVSLDSSLSINKDLVIDGNGVTITQNGSWTNSLLDIASGSAVKISRVHFKGGRGFNYGGAITNNGGTLTIESCIFSGNQGGTYGGGAIYNTDAGTIKITGCTFYGNSINSSNGGAVRNNSGYLTLTGNLFYGNTAASYPVVSNNGTTTSGGYNVADVPLGTGSAQSGWTAAATDKSIGTGLSSLPISPSNFKLLSSSGGAFSGAANVITTLPDGYPALDFYGDPINSGAAAGAVQSAVNGSGYYIEWSINNPLAGTVAASSPLNEDNFYSAEVTLEASPTSPYSFEYWLVNGVQNTANPLTVNYHARVQAVFAKIVTVTSSADTNTEGTLRYALANAQNGDIIRFDSSVTEITVGSSALPEITGNKSITIEGNGVVIKRTGTSGSTLEIASGATVNISRVHFTGSRVTNYPGAIYNRGTLNLESCIFSDNQGNSGGAIGNSDDKTMTVKGCTFYGNTATQDGGAINNSGTLTLTGNLFYGNTAIGRGPVVFCYQGSGGGTVISGGYNVSDGTLVTNARVGYTPGTGDTTIGTDFANLPISGKTFKLIQGANGDALKIMNTLPEGYPAVDFYGDPIYNGAAAGAVQSGVSGSGYYIEWSINNPNAGTVAASSPLNEDNFYSAALTLTANPTGPYSFEYWLVNGVQNTDNPLTVNYHARVQAVFAKIVTVTSSADTNAVGTLRYALANAENGDIIRIASTVGTIELTSALPTINVTKSIIIEGNGVILDGGNSTRLLGIGSSAVAHVSRIHFKGGWTTAYGGAIVNSGTLTLESCIFSDNKANGDGGAIYNALNATLTVKGCTFYNNTANKGGVIYNYNNGGTLTLTGNLFYGNKASSQYDGHVVYDPTITVKSGGYNVVDVALGNYYYTFEAATGDKTIENLLGNNATTPFITSPPVNAADFAPVAGLQAVMPETAIADFPLTDFSGDTRTWPGAPGAVK